MIPNDRAFNGNSFFEFDGKTFFRYKAIKEPGKYFLKIKLVSKNSPYRQGLAISFSTKPAFQGTVLINGVPFTPPEKKHLVHVIGEELFSHNDLEIEILLESGSVYFCNASDISYDYREMLSKIAKATSKPVEEISRENFTSGLTATNLYGNAFWIETISNNKYRFHCNDHKMDDDFDDLVFDLEFECS